MGNFIAIITFGCFCVLASYAQGTTHRHEVHVVEQRAKPVTIWRTRKAAVLAEVWGITPEELDNPVSIWGKP